MKYYYLILLKFLVLILFIKDAKSKQKDQQEECALLMSNVEFLITVHTQLNIIKYN